VIRKLLLLIVSIGLVCGAGPVVEKVSRGYHHSGKTYGKGEYYKLSNDMVSYMIYLQWVNVTAKSPPQVLVGVPEGCRVQGAGCRVQGAGCRVQGAGCRVQGAGCGVRGAGCRVQGAGGRVRPQPFFVHGKHGKLGKFVGLLLRRMEWHANL
jgi:hypothetical protein